MWPYAYAISIIIFQEKVLADSLLIRILDRVQFVNTWPEIVWITTECDAEQLQETIHSVEQRLWCIGDGMHRWCTLEHNDTIGQVSGHDEIVLNDEAGFLCVQNVSVDKEFDMNEIALIKDSGIIEHLASKALETRKIVRALPLDNLGGDQTLF